MTDVTGRDGSVTDVKPLLYIGGDGCDPSFKSGEKFWFFLRREERFSSEGTTLHSSNGCSQS